MKTYYIVFRVILIKNMINERNHTMTTDVMCPSVVVYVTVLISVTNAQS